MARGHHRVSASSPLRSKGCRGNSPESGEVAPWRRPRRSNSSSCKSTLRGRHSSCSRARLTSRVSLPRTWRNCIRRWRRVTSTSRGICWRRMGTARIKIERVLCPTEVYSDGDDQPQWSCPSHPLPLRLCCTAPTPTRRMSWTDPLPRRGGSRPNFQLASPSGLQVGP